MEPEGTAPRPGVDQLRAVGRALLRIPFPLSLLPVVLWGGLIWHLSSFREVDTGPLIPRLPLLGNLAHAFEFGMLALWSVLLLPRRAGWPALTRAGALSTCALLVAYAFVDEWHQAHVPERNASLLDLVTDGVGIASVLAVIAYLGRPAASAAGLRRRLVAGLVACLAAASLATVYQTRHGAGPWPFGAAEHGAGAAEHGGGRGEGGAGWKGSPGRIDSSG